MSNMNSDNQGYSFGQSILAVVAGVVGYAVLVVLVAKIFGVSICADATEPAAALAKVEQNIKPIAVVELAAAGSGAQAEKSGAEVVKAVCAMCHAAGLMNAPKIGDNAQWGPRIAQGYDTLVKNALAGIRSMPARGGNPALTDGEIARAVAEMANASGAKFTPPALKAADAKEAVDAPAK